MKQLFLLLLLISMLSCNPHKSMLTKQRKMWDYKHWVSDFKDRVLCKCLLAGYGEKIADSILAVDKTYYDPIAISIFDDKIDSLLYQEVSKMSSDSLESLSTVSEGAAGKTVFSHCIKFYKSSELNSIARMESVKWKQIGNIDSVVMKAIPAF